MSRNYYTPCNEPGCDRSNANGHNLYRVNLKGVAGDFRCSEHARRTPPDLPLHRTWAGVPGACSTCDGGGCHDCTELTGC